MYVAMLKRPDIAFSVSYLSQFNNNNCYDLNHWKQVKRILKYLQKTKLHGLKFCKDNVNAQLVGFLYADWAHNTSGIKSYTGFCFLVLQVSNILGK